MASVYLVKGKLRKASFAAAGYDIFSTVATIIPIGGIVTVDTGIQTTMAAGVVGIIKDRSGLAKNSGITVLAGVIDSDYDQEWKVVLHNAGKYPFVINIGDRIAQAVFLNHLEVAPYDKEAIVEVGDMRIGGFGSTGQ